MKSYKEFISEEVTQKQIQDLEKFGDRLLSKFDVDVEFSRHFADRMNDDRNKPAIKVAEIQKLFKKIAKQKASKIKSHVNAEVVLNDIQSDLNLPVAIKMVKGEVDVVHKTIMRKKNFATSNPKIRYEEKELDEISPSLKQRYADKAKSDVGFHRKNVNVARQLGANDAKKYYSRKAKNRIKGLRKVRTEGFLDVVTPQWLHKLAMKPQETKLVRAYLNWRRDNPGKGKRGVQDVIKLMGLPPRDGNILIDALNDLVKQGKLPKHLALN